MSAKSKEIAKHTESAPNEVAATLQVIERAASNRDVDVLKLEKLLEMQERILARNAKTAFDAAMARMAPELPTIEKRGEIRVRGHVQSTYPLWEDIDKAIRPLLSKHGFTLSFRTGTESNHLTVTGVVSHTEGHSEETTIYLPHDQSGSKNAVQAVGSSITYGKRYTASALLNLIFEGDSLDDDGEGADPKATITEHQQAELESLIDEVKANREAFLEWAGIKTLEAMPAAKYDQAVRLLERKRKEAQ